MRVARCRPWVAFLGALIVVAATMTTAGALSPNPAALGKWSAPFEEGGVRQPECRNVKGSLVCKPTAVTAIALSDGRVLYWDGIEGSEKIKYQGLIEGATLATDSRARILDLRDGHLRFGKPTPDTGGARNPNIDPNRDPISQLFGDIGAPGRPGDGPMGSTVGQIAPMPPTNPPDDPWGNDGDLFCTDVTHLADGRILIAGGTDWYSEPGLPSDTPVAGGWGVTELEGLRNTRIFDPGTNRFTQVGNMKYGRWYPTQVMLPNGKVLVASGVTKLVKSAQGGQVRRTETFDPKTGRWTQNYTGTASENSLPLYPRLHLMPNGKIFFGGVGQFNGFGPTGWAADEATWSFQQFFNLKTRQWETVGLEQLGPRNGAFSVMLPLKPPYDKATLLVGGGTLMPTPSTPFATTLSELITVDKAGNVTNGMTGDLVNPRWFSTAVALPDGTVAAFGGSDTDTVNFAGYGHAVRQAELYDPAKGTWTPLATGNRDREYHNSALLLADGSVLMGGHDPIPTYPMIKHQDVPGFDNNWRDPSFEIYRPPYMFRGTRPQIAYAPSSVAWGSTFRVQLSKATNVSSVVLVRLSDITHTVDADQRSVELAFTRNGSTLTVKAPPTGITAPPGPYYLFVNRRAGSGQIPSIASVVTVGSQMNMADAFEPLQSAYTAARTGSAHPPGPPS